MPYNNLFDNESAFTKMRLKSRCPFATGAIAPNYIGIRHESFHDRPFGTPANVGSTAGSIEDFEPGGQSALHEGASHIPFAMKYRGGKESMRNPYNMFGAPPFGSAHVLNSQFGRAPDAPHRFGAPSGVIAGKERFIGRGGVGVLYGRPQNVGRMPIGLQYT